MTPKARAHGSGTISTLYARGLLDYLRERGVDTATLYPAARVHTIEGAYGHEEITIAEWIAMFGPAIAALNEPVLPLLVGASLRLHHLGVLGQVLTGCKTLCEAAAQLRRYIRLLGEIGEPELLVENGQAHMFWTAPPGLPAGSDALIVQHMLGARTSFIRWLVNRPDLRLDAHFHFPRPADLRAYERVFGGELCFSQPRSKLVFPTAWLDLPIGAADEEMRRQIETRAQLLLSNLDGEAPLMVEVKRVLAHNLAAGRVSLEETAKALRVSTRTLQRRLGELDRSFHSVLDEVRRGAAEALLRDPGVPLKEIAFSLGFSDQNGFLIAFRRWTGDSPSSWRHRNSPSAAVCEAVIC
ncbi:AraC family transcriptional regulator ligand-binding domain-containing protein [Fontimonas sp. SYSU GA230001]|uniref:AraC family transcriptional regulator n=1 Tax=Fontimonas sp. SYSU GA230001 TaxID=3142450 RepID=UPI0032B4F3CA